MKQRNLPILASASLATLLTACSGGGSGAPNSVNNDTEQNGDTNNTIMTIPKVGITEHPLIPITEDNVEANIAKIHRVLKKQIREMKSQIDDVDLDKGATLIPTAGNGEIQAQTLDCERGGTWSIAFIDGPQSFVDQQGSTVSGAGAKVAQQFLECGSEYYKSPNILWGSTQTEVIRGLFDNFSILSKDTLLRDTSEHFVVVNKWITDPDKKDFGKYIHGVTETEYTTAGALVFRGDLLASKNPQSYDYPGDLQLRDFEFTMIKAPGKYSWDATYDLHEADNFIMDLVNDDQRFVVKIATNLVFNDALGKITDGAVQISSAQGILIAQYFKDHVDYQLDADENGDYEITGTIIKSSL